jgi:hypothetical protein
MPRNDLAVITCYYNPCHYENRKKNYKLFQARLEKQDVPCLTVECVLGEDSPDLDPGPDIITVRTKDSIWQKERLLNIAIDNISPKYTKIAWLDCDILLSDPLWASKASDLLDTYKIIQPFDRIGMLTPKAPEYPVLWKYWMSFAGNPILLGSKKHGHTGHAWAARRDLLDKHHLYDAAIMGNGDHMMGHAINGYWDNPCLSFLTPSPGFQEHFFEWAKPFYGDIQGRTISLRGEALHLWHGDQYNRQYETRHLKLKNYEFDPKTDLKINSQGAWEWASDKPDLHKMVHDYFYKRREDG